MSDEETRSILRAAEALDDPAEWLRASIAVRRSAPDERSGLMAAAAALDRAFGLAPKRPDVVEARRQTLDALAITEQGLRFRYVPDGPFLMGSERGEPDECPVHRVTLDAFWISDTPVSWDAFGSIMGWGSPADFLRQQDRRPTVEHAGRTVDVGGFGLHIEDQIRVQYCENETPHAGDWHAHWPRDPGVWPDRTPQRAHPEAPLGYDQKPMVAISWRDSQLLGERLSSPGVLYRLPTEAEWEKAARGGLVGMRYPWGDERPTPERCDFGRLDEVGIRPPRQFPPNGYGLHGMSGTVWEWTLDRYDSRYYAESPARNPTGPTEGKHRVLRGGSWTDDAGVVTTSFRMSRGPGSSWLGREEGEDGVGWHQSPNIGFRLCRVERVVPA